MTKRPENVQEFDGYNVPERGTDTPENRAKIKEMQKKFEEEMARIHEAHKAD